MTNHHLASGERPRDRRLQKVVDAWPGLPEPFRKVIDNVVSEWTRFSSETGLVARGEASDDPS